MSFELDLRLVDHESPTDEVKTKYELVALWLNNKEHMRYSEQRHKIHTFKTVFEYRLNFDSSQHFLWDIYRLPESYLVGTITAHIDAPNRRAELGILIGPEFGQCGYGAFAWQRVMDYMKPRVDVIEAGFMLDNIGMKKICEKCGMRPSGFMIDHFILDGKREACLFYAWRK
jgi:[ribosomal protein S5]-alanine N-acetyltransferase